MSFQQPTSKIICPFHFEGNAYEFPVESVLQSDQGNGQLRIEASTGYLLTTLANAVPHHQQTLTYTKQPDGSWLASSIVRLLANGPSLISGIVTLYDPLGKRFVLTVTIDAFLSTSGSTVTFNNTEPGTETLAILKISQQGADTPIMLSSDDPNRFTLAADRNEVSFTPTLTITPSFGGTCIYIRYAPNRTGRHSARLVVTTPYDTQTILLEGRAGDQSAWYRSARWAIVATRPEIRVSESAIKRVRLWAAPAILLLIGMLYAGYVYRCQLIPDICQSQGVAETATRFRDTVLVAPSISVFAIDKKPPIEKVPVEPKLGAAYDKDHKEVHRVNEVRTPPIEALTIRRPLNQVNQIAKPLRQKQSKRQALVKKNPAKNDEESDLEKELNNTKSYRP